MPCFVSFKQNQVLVSFTRKLAVARQEGSLVCSITTKNPNRAKEEMLFYLEYRVRNRTDMIDKLV